MRLGVRVVPLLISAVFTTACKKEAEPAKPAVAAPADVRPDVLAPGETCAEDGRWKPCTVLDRMERAGLVVKEVPADTTRVAYLTPPGLHYTVGKNASLIAFYFNDSLSAKAEWAKLDTLRLVPPGDTTSRWPKTPTPIRAANLIAVFFGSNAPQIERVQLMFEGGLPAPR